MHQKTIHQLIEENPSRALLLDEMGVDYRLLGDKTLEQVCGELNLDPALLQNKLASVGGLVYSIDFNLVSVPFLIEYLVNTHHDYAKAKLPAIRRVITTMARENENHRELEKTFRKFSNQMRKHIILEEEVVFPLILNLQKLAENFDRDGAASLLSRYSTEILCHNHEHDEDEMHELRTLTSNFRIKKTDNLSYRIVMHELLQLQFDMEQHAKIEENVLFKKAGQMEDALRKRLRS